MAAASKCVEIERKRKRSWRSWRSWRTRRKRRRKRGGRGEEEEGRRKKVTNAILDFTVNNCSVLDETRPTLTTKPPSDADPHIHTSINAHIHTSLNVPIHTSINAHIEEVERTYEKPTCI